MNSAVMHPLQCKVACYSKRMASQFDPSSGLPDPIVEDDQQEDWERLRPEQSPIDAQIEVTHGHLEHYLTDLVALQTSLKNLLNAPDDATRDPEHFHLEVIRLLTKIAAHSERTATLTAVTARNEPLSVSIPRLAKMLGISVNTLRTRLMIGAGASDDPLEETR